MLQDTTAMNSHIVTIRDTIREHAPMPRGVADIVIGYAISAGSILMLMPDVYPPRADELSNDYFYTYAPCLGISLHIIMDLWNPLDLGMILGHGIHTYSIHLTVVDNPLDKLLMMDLRNLGLLSGPLASAIKPMHMHLQMLTDKCFARLLKS